MRPTSSEQTVTARGHRLRSLLLAAILLGFAAALFIVVKKVAFDRELAAALDRGRTTLSLASNALEGRLNRFRNLPSLMAQEGAVVALLHDPADPALRAQVDSYFKDVSALLGASVIYLMTPDGETIAASNYKDPLSFVGQNFSFRPYFKQAISGGYGQFFALGTTSGKRGYYFSSAVPILGKTAGVVVFKIDLGSVESSWTGNGDQEIVVTDPEGIIFLSSRTDWRYRSLAPLDQTTLDRIRKSRRYDGEQLRALPIERRRNSAGGDLIDVRLGQDTRQYAVLSNPMLGAGWNVRVLVNTAPVHAQAFLIALISLLVAGLIALAAVIALRERSRLSDRLRIQRAERGRLEERVELRTRDLARANARLEGEVRERRATEIRLRKTQDDLIQASKLAALGQMSAALSHEFNQPLAALSVYAENAETCLESDRPDLVRDNLARISRLIARLSSLSRHLNSFARKPGEQLRTVELSPAIDAVLEILGGRIEATGTTLTREIDAGAERVVAGDVRLQQVLMNLIANALDVIEAGAPPRITITARAEEARQVALSVRDWGPGVSRGTADRLFDPFFSTKGPGKGLGLGLSISYNIVRDFGGMLSVENAPDGGAIFILKLQAAANEQQTAESGAT